MIVFQCHTEFKSIMVYWFPLCYSIVSVEVLIGGSWCGVSIGEVLFFQLCPFKE